MSEESVSSETPHMRTKKESETCEKPLAVRFPQSLREFREGVIHYKIAERVEQRKLRSLIRGIVNNRTEEFCPEREVFLGRS